MHRNAFTLVELLVAIVIMGVISSMVVIALSGAQRQAQETRAEGMINRLNLTILQIYDEESRKRVGIGGTPLYTVAFSGMPDPARTMNRTQLIWNRDWMRVALPDRIADLMTDSLPIQHLVYGVDPTINTNGMAPSSYQVVSLVPNDAGPTSRRDSRRNLYRNRVLRTLIALAPSRGWTAPTSWADVVDGSAANGEWTAQYQGAECLYLILASHNVNGQPASESLNSRDVGDLDGDGMFEVLDPWGTPVAFIRWPVGFYLGEDWDPNPSSPTVTPAEIELRKQKLGPDYQDVLRNDPRFGTISLTDDTFQLLPIVVSAGSDGEFDLYGVDESVAPPAIAYGTMTWSSWPLPAGYVAPMAFPDPFREGTGLGLQLGYRGDYVDTGTDNSSDNVYPALNF